MRTARSLRDGARTTASSLAPLAGALGAIELGRWLIGGEAWTSPPASTAVGLLVGSVALVLLAETSPARRKLLGRGCAGVMFLAGAAGLVGSVPCSLVMMLIAAALGLLDRGSDWRVPPAELLLVAAGMVVHALLVALAYDAVLRGEAAAATTTALLPPIALGLLVLGALLARPARGWMATITAELDGGVVARRLLAGAIAGPPLLGFAVVAAANTTAPDMKQAVSHSLLATSSAAIAALVVLRTASSLNEVDAARRAGEVELRRWRDVAESTDEAMMSVTLDRKVNGWNRAATRMFGYRREEIVGRSIEVLMIEEARAESTLVLERLLAGEPVPAFETVRRRKDGSRIEVSLSLSLQLDTAGRPIGISGVARDIGAQRAVEAARRALELQYRELFEHASDGIFVTDREGRYAEANTAGCRMLGYTREQIVGGTPIDFVAPADAVRLSTFFEALRRGDTVVSDWQVRAADGALVPVESSVKMLPDGRRQAIVRDLRTRKAAETAAARAHAVEHAQRLRLEEQATWLQAVIDGMPEAVILADASGRMSCNQIARRFYRPVIEGGEPRLWLDLRDAEGAPLVAETEPLSRALKGEHCAGEELCIRDALATDTPVLASASPLRDPNGALMGAVCVLRDISPLKELERLREQWAAVVAHDLRQPLTVIAVSARTLESVGPTAAEPTVARVLARIVSASARMNRMIDDLLDATRIQSRQLTLKREEIDLQGLMAEVVARTDAGEGRIVRLRCPRPLPRLPVDTCRIEQVLDNLLSNAIKYGTSEADIQVEAHATGEEVIVSVSNSGPPLSPEVMRRLFTRYYRAPGARQQDGLGLGLYIAKGLVEGHGGRIWAESAADRTRFSFSLPVS